MREPELVNYSAEDIVRRTVALKGALPFLDARSLHLAPGLLLAEPTALAAAVERLTDGDGGGGESAERYTHDKLRVQPDRILAEIGYWDDDNDDDEGQTEGSGRAADSTSDREASRSKRMYTRISPDATDVAAVRKRIEERQRGSKKRL